MSILNKIKLGNLDNKLLGCGWAIQGDRLLRLEKDFFAENVKYSYVTAGADSKTIKTKVGRIVAGIISNKILNDSSVEGELIYLPTLKVGDKLIAMNTSRTYLIDKFFPKGYIDVDASTRFMTLEENSIDCSDTRPLAVDVSNYEIDYILDLNELCKEEQYHIVFVPFYVGTIKSKLYSFKFLYKAYGDNCFFVSDLIQREYVNLNAFLLILFSVICYVIVLVHMPPLNKDLFMSYFEWSKSIIYFPETIQYAWSIDDNIFLFLLWLPVKLILYVIMIIMAIGVLPAIATLCPIIISAIISRILIYCIMKMELVNNLLLWNSKI